RLLSDLPDDAEAGDRASDHDGGSGRQGGARALSACTPAPPDGRRPRGAGRPHEREAEMAIDREALLGRVREALAKVKHPATGVEVLSGGQVTGLEVDDEGKVRFQFVLKPEDPGTLVREARAAVEAVEGVARAKIDVKLPDALQAQRQQQAAGPQGGGRPLRPHSVPAPTPDPSLLRGVEHGVAVSSGKGGVGKSTVAANLAVALAASGRRVGLLDADIYGPDIPLMFGERRRPQVTGERGQEKIVPLEAHGVRLM